MNYLLKHKDIDVALISFNDEGGIIRILEIYCKEHFPLSVVKENGSADAGRLGQWWNERGIPKTRENYPEILNEMGERNKNKVLVECNGLNLTDHYWVCEYNTDKKWETINFYDNDFNSDVGDLFFRKKKNDKKYGRNSPDVGSGGNLRKRWMIGPDNTRLLVKAGRKPYLQEPCNEVIATVICEYLNIPHVPYILKKRDGEPVCYCTNMTTKDIEFIDAINVYDTRAKNINDSLYDHYSKCTDALHIANITPMLDRMMVLDYTLFNHDRHFRNFGVMRNSSTLEYVGPAPIFDSGSSLYNEDSARTIAYPERAALRTQCFDTLENQLGLVTDWSWYKDIQPVIPKCAELLRSVDSVEKERADRIVSVLNSRVNDLNIYVEKIALKPKMESRQKPVQKQGGRRL
jgi:hypothetical protein